MNFISFSAINCRLSTAQAWTGVQMEAPCSVVILMVSSECGGLGATSRVWELLSKFENVTWISVLRTNQLLFLIVAVLKFLGISCVCGSTGYIYVGHGFEANNVFGFVFITRYYIVFFFKHGYEVGLPSCLRFCCYGSC